MLFKKRDRFTKVSESIGKSFGKIGFSPNTWTFLTLIFAIITFLFLCHQAFLWAAFFFAVTAFIDLVDGSVARHTGRVTKKGGYLDTIIDRYVEFIVVLGLFLITLPAFLLDARAWIFIYFFGALMTTYAKAAAKEKELSKTEIKGGFLERGERMIVLFIGIVLAFFNPLYLTYILAALAIASNVTALHRIWIAWSC